MPTINWDESVPADSENAGLGDDRIRSLKTSVRVGLDAEHVWPSGGGDAGVHRLGSARPFYAVQSLVSSTGTDGRLMVTSDTSRLFHVGSGGTMFLGGQAAISAGSSPVGGQNFYWAHEFGAVLSSATTTTINFANSGFSGVPFTVISLVTSLTQGLAGHIAALTATSMSVRAFITNTGSNASNVTIMYHSIGTRTL